ncbi:MAG: NAD+ synthase [Deltaproteobacteria bacterium]|nr:NAD+ synthase [Deltaproteobacteria bacterium]
MKVALAQINTTIGDFKNNSDKIIAYAERARSLACDLVIFPELAVSGYPPRDLLERKDFVDANLKWLNHLVESIHEIGVICGCVDKNASDTGKLLLNTAVLFENGEILYKANKRLLPTYDIFDEGRYFEPGIICRAFAYKNRRLGITVCEDIWNHEDVCSIRSYNVYPVTEMIKDNADLIINVSASPFNIGKSKFKNKMLSSVAKKYKVPLIYVNQVGGNDSVLFDGVSTVFNHKGEIVACACDFDEDFVVYDDAALSTDIHDVSESDNASVLKALIRGTRDYVLKCSFSKAVIGLSGGIDSALTACIAVEALGKDNISAVFMPSEYTSDDNFEDTKALSENLGIELTTIPINAIFHEHLKSIFPSSAIDDPGVTEQNIQARIRGTILMAISNKHNSLLLTTGNKSELAVGYCTLYGDMNGGLAVISDIPKTMVWDISRYINRKREIIPSRIISKAPSAELKPGQTDQDDLPPYDIMDRILTGYIEESKSSDELAGEGYDLEIVKDIIRRVDLNEYKRHQAAPGLRVTSKAFGEGRRYPIARKF